MKAKIPVPNSVVPNSVPEVAPKFLTIKQASAYSGATVNAVRSLIWANKLPYAKIGKRYVIPVAALDQFLNQQLRYAGGLR